MRPVRAALALGGLLLLAGCASMPPTPGERRDERLDALEKRVLELSQQAAVSDVEITRLRQQVAMLEARLGERPAAATRSSGPGAAPASAASSPAASAPAASSRPAPPPASGSVTPRTTEVTVTAPRPASAAGSRAHGGALEESELPDEPAAVPSPAPLAKPAAKASSGAATPARPAPAKPRATPAPAAPAAAVPVTPAPPAAAPAAAPASGAAVPSGEGGPVPRDAQAVYDAAYTLYHQGKYDEAEARFEEFLAQAPATELSDNAQYWIGAARFEKKDYKGALAAFRRTVERYPEANKVPDALYKIGQCLEELKQPAQALQVYDELVKRFPETAAGTLAAERKAKLRP